MIAAFQVFSDPNGNLWVADGYVSQLRTGVLLPVGSGTDFSAVFPPAWDRFLAAPATTAATFVGGSGRNLVLTGITPAPSGPSLPVGIFVPGRPDSYARGIFSLVVTGSSDATIHDGTDTVAILSTGGTAPVGNYVGTTYGRTTYNGGSAFTLAAAAEQGAPGVFPAYLATQSAAVAQDGAVIATDAANYYFDNDSDWTIVIAADGTAEMLYLTDVIATRAAASNSDPAGLYEATELGRNTYNSGDPWSVFIDVVPAAPRAGFGYVTLTESDSVLASAEGPFFATSLPADSSTVFHIPLFQSDGLGAVVQIHAGLLAWPGGNIAYPTQTRHIQVPAVLRGNPSTQPTADGVGSASGLKFSNSGSKYAYFQWEIPSDWTGGDITVEIDWCPFSGAMSGSNTVKWLVSYGLRAVGETIGGTLTVVPSTISGIVGQYVTTHTQHVLAASDADNPIAHEDHLFVRIERDNTVANNWSGDVLVTAFEVLYASNGIPEV
jgi:hypothetical protein